MSASGPELEVRSRAHRAEGSLLASEILHSSLVGQVLNGRQLLGIKNLTSKRRILMRTLSSFLDNDLIVSSAAIAYFGMLVLFPTVLLITAWYPSALLN